MLTLRRSSRRRRLEGPNLTSCGAFSITQFSRCRHFGIPSPRALFQLLLGLVWFGFAINVTSCCRCFSETPINPECFSVLKRPKKKEKKGKIMCTARTVSLKCQFEMCKKRFGGWGTVSGRAGTTWSVERSNGKARGVGTVMKTSSLRRAMRINLYSATVTINLCGCKIYLDLKPF